MNDAIEEADIIKKRGGWTIGICVLCTLGFLLSFFFALGFTMSNVDIYLAYVSAIFGYIFLSFIVVTFFVNRKYLRKSRFFIFYFLFFIYMIIAVP